MKKILMAMYLIGGLAMLFSCNDDSSSYPTPSDIDNLKATPGPGQINLSWTTPADENLYYVQVEYASKQPVNRTENKSANMPVNW